MTGTGEIVVPSGRLVAVGVAIVTSGETVVASVGVTVDPVAAGSVELSVGVMTSTGGVVSEGVSVPVAEEEAADSVVVEVGSSLVVVSEDDVGSALLVDDDSVLAGGRGASGVKLQVLFPPFGDCRGEDGHGMVTLVFGSGQR
jgi:hypothetical protein